ncbi:MAG: dihydroorotate dehydrogenase, partial [Candidatus Omnitrophica bacterium]|nr:dihydroorotate dehydrogenase [Candidatus Omnitrophota bacterium]
ALNNPIICASGTFGYGDELKGLVDYQHIGAITTKTITLQPREGNPPPRIFETEFGVLNSVGLENPGINNFIKYRLPLIRKVPAKKIISIGGFSSAEYKKCLEILDEQKGIDAFEINLSCPNLRLKKLISQDPKATHDLSKELRKLTNRPLFIKITPEVNDIAEIARAVEDAGCDGVSLVNTYFSLAIDIEAKRPVLGNICGGYSGPAIKPMSLYRVYKARKAVKIPIIAGGGICKASDAVEFILAGATAISLGTANLTDPNRCKDIILGIKEYMRKKKVSDINKLTGGLIE